MLFHARHPTQYQPVTPAMVKKNISFLENLPVKEKSVSYLER